MLELKAPTNYSILLLKAHIWKLEEAREMDEEIAPNQLAGVPFLFQVLPKIAILKRNHFEAKCLINFRVSCTGISFDTKQIIHQSSFRSNIKTG
jgi:hypothetical protein